MNEPRTIEPPVEGTEDDQATLDEAEEAKAPLEQDEAEEAKDPLEHLKDRNGYISRPDLLKAAFDLTKKCDEATARANMLEGLTGELDGRIAELAEELQATKERLEETRQAAIQNKEKAEVATKMFLDEQFVREQTEAVNKSLKRVVRDQRKAYNHKSSQVERYRRKLEEMQLALAKGIDRTMEMMEQWVEESCAKKAADTPKTPLGAARREEIIDE